MKKVLFVDRDGTLLVEPPQTQQINDFSEMDFVPGVILSLKRFAEAGYEIVMVTNQDCLGTAKNPLPVYKGINDLLFRVLNSENISFQQVFECPHVPADDCDCRKPKIGMLDSYLQNHKINREASVMVGDRATDREFGDRLGISTYLVTETTWPEIAAAVLKKPRIATVKRDTTETKIEAYINLDGQGKYEIDTGLKFFDHMLEQLAKHGGFDIRLHCKGDLQIDEHHTIEDTGLALGKCFYQAIGDKGGITRYAWERILPMDEARAEVCLDISGRPYLVFAADFKREYVGDFPTEMLAHFYRSFCEQAGINLNIRLTGENTHHLIEVSFKAFARCLKDAVKREGSAPPSTKGVL